MKRLLLLLALTPPILAKAQTTAALPLPIDGSTWVTLNMINDTWSQMNGAYKLSEYIEFDGSSAWEIIAVQVPDCIVFIEQSSWSSFEQVGNKWYRNGVLYFDWDLTVGESIELADWPGDALYVSSIDTVEYADFIPRRVFHMSYSDGNPFLYYMELTYIEGIGSSLWGIEEPNGAENMPFFQCFYDKNGLLLLHNDWTPSNLIIPNTCCTPIAVEEMSTSAFSIFPSPATDQTSIQFEATHIPQSIQIFNATGQLMHTEKVLGRLQMQLNVSEYAKGIYTVRGRFENGEEVSEKLVVE
jgi:hypothetical protein